MPTPEQNFQNRDLTDDERVMLAHLSLQAELAEAAETLSVATQTWHNVLEKVLDCNQQLRDRGINLIDHPEFCYERPMPEYLGGPEAPILTIVTD